MRKLLPAIIISALSFFVLLSSTRSATAALAGHVVISEIQIAGSTSTADFVELYNPTGTTVDLSDYRLVKRTASGDTDTSIVAFQSGDSIAPYSYFLWCNTEISDAMACDRSTSGTVSNNNSIGLREGALDTGTLIDAVTIGEVENPLGEGTSLTAPVENQSVERLPGEVMPNGGNGEDTDDNNADFSLRTTSQPQNTTSSPEQPEESPTITQDPSPTDEATPTLTDSITPTASPTATITPPSSQGTVVISEIQIGGGSSMDEFVELYNTSDESVDVSGWKLWRKTASGTEFSVLVILSGSIPAHGYYLAAHVDYDGLVVEDVTYSDDSVSANNTIQLVTSADEYVDKVGMGSALDFEGADTASSPANDRSIERKATADSTGATLAPDGEDEFKGNGYDTDNNDSDFVLRPATASADPQNTASTPESVDGVTPTPTVTDTPTPTVTESPTPTASPTATISPSETPSVTASPTEAVTPTSTPSPTPTTSPSPAPRRIIGIFPMSRRVCFLDYEVFEFGFYRFFFPRVSCEVV